MSHQSSIVWCADSLRLRIARYWKDPHEFKPQRFLENWPRDAFLPFSGGKYLVASVTASMISDHVAQAPAPALDDGQFAFLQRCTVLN